MRSVEAVFHKGRFRLMGKRVLRATAVFIAYFFLAGAAPAQRDRFITIEGPDLKSKIESAVRQGRARSAAFFVAYGFDVRPGVAVDADVNEFRGTTNTFSGASVSIGTSRGATVETRNLGIFMLYDAEGRQVTRVEVYNLERQREYGGYQVYWAGRASNQESLDLMRSLAESGQPRTAERAVMAIGLHDDQRVGSILKEMFRGVKQEKVRSGAIFWLGQIGGEQPFLAEVARDENESVKVRKEAVFSIGISKDEGSLAALKNLYDATTNREVKKQIIFAASINHKSDEAVDFLIRITQSDAEIEARKQALFWLGQKAGERSLKVLGDTVNSEADVELQKEAVFAISRRPAEQSIPMLINVARTHKSAEVRKQAIFWLSRTNDPRAVEFFQEILSK
jgi:HEAT repeat protein